MADDALPPLDRGAGTSDDLVIGAVDALERIIPTVNQLVAAMLDLQDRAAELEAETPETAPSIAPAPWVKWLRVAYKIESSIPENWDSIPGAAQELHALHAAWCAAYKSNGVPRPGHAAAAWHDSLDSFGEIITLRARYYEGTLPPVDKRFTALDSQMRLRMLAFCDVGLGKNRSPTEQVPETVRLASCGFGVRAGIGDGGTLRADLARIQQLDNAGATSAETGDTRAHVSVQFGF